MSAGDITEAQRVETDKVLHRDTAAGSYTGVTRGFTGDKPAVFYKLPNGGVGHVTAPPHTFEEHEDGTVTVSPSILHRGDDGWHGFLERGVWREV